MKTEKLLNALKGNAEVREAIKNLADASHETELSLKDWIEKEA